MSVSSYLSQIKRIEHNFRVGCVDTAACGIVLAALKSHVQVEPSLSSVDKDAIYKEITRVSQVTKDLDGLADQV